MKNKAIINISQMMSTDKENKMKISMSGNIQKKDDRYVVCYEEFDVQTDDKTEVELNFSDEDILIKKRGYINADMKIDNKSSKMVGEYTTQFGSLPMEIHSLKYRMVNTRNLTLYLRFKLFVSEQLIGENYMKIDIITKNCI